MSRALSDLDSRFRPLADQLLAKFREVTPTAVIYTSRTQAEQDAAVASGASKVKHSKHQDGLAIDVCPIKLLDKKLWAPSDPIWWDFGAIGRGLGLRWGGQWNRNKPPPVGKVPKYFFDPGHFEMILPADPIPAPIT